MKLSHDRTDSSVVVSFSGELGHHEAAETLQYIKDVIDLYMPKRLELDFSGLSFMDSSGIAVIMSSFKGMSAIGGTFSVSAVPEQAKKVLTASGLTKIININ